MPALGYVPPPDNRSRNRILGATAFVGFVIIVFVAGSLIHGSELRAEKAAQNALTTPDAPGASSPRSKVTLVPAESGSPTQWESPITSAPAQPQSVDMNGERTDATALPSESYAAAAQRAKAERDARTNTGMIDPRTFAGNVEARRPRTVSNPVEQPQSPTALQTGAPAAQQPESSTAQVPQTSLTAAPPRTKPIPIDRPVPVMTVDHPESARLLLTIGPDGRVSDINVLRPIPGQMPPLLATVQRWRFKPATENGQPVTSTYSIDINVHP